MKACLKSLVIRKYIWYPQENTTIHLLGWQKQKTKTLIMSGTSLAVQLLRRLTSTTRGIGSISGWGTKFPHNSWYGQKNKTLIMPSTGEHVGNLVHSYAVGGNATWESHVGNQSDSFLQNWMHIWPSNIISQPLTKDKWKLTLTQKPTCNFIHYCQNSETTQMSFNWQTDKLWYSPIKRN